MSNTIGFFTAIKYEQETKTTTQSLLETIDNYFYLGGKKAYILQEKTKDGREKVVLSEGTSSLFARAIKTLSYCTLFLPAIALITKCVLRATHTFRVIDPKKKLEKDIDISEGTLSEIQNLMPKILHITKDPEIEWLSTGNNLVFKLRENPQLIFKTVRPNCSSTEKKLPTGDCKKTNHRFENMIKAKEVCLSHQLGLLVIPQAQKFTINAEGNDYVFIAEKSLSFNPKKSGQEQLYLSLSDELTETIRQLATFTAKTSFNDVTFRNIPILNESSQYKGQRRVGLIDLESMENSKTGFIGDCNGSCGLIRCVAEKHIDSVISEARKRKAPITNNEAANAKNQRLKELQSDKELEQFYQKHDIKNGDEPIQLDEEILDFSEYPQPQAEELKKLAIDLVKEINNQVTKSSQEDSVKGRRHVFINPNSHDSPFYATDSLFIGESNRSSYKTDEEYENSTYLGCVIKKLLDC